VKVQGHKPSPFSVESTPKPHLYPYLTSVSCFFSCLNGHELTGAAVVVRLVVQSPFNLVSAAEFAWNWTRLPVQLPLCVDMSTTNMLSNVADVVSAPDRVKQRKTAKARTTNDQNCLCARISTQMYTYTVPGAKASDVTTKNAHRTPSNLLRSTDHDRNTA
jgi:hypothetical protein